MVLFVSNSVASAHYRMCTYKSTAVESSAKKPTQPYGLRLLLTFINEKNSRGNKIDAAQLSNVKNNIIKCPYISLRSESVGILSSSGSIFPTLFAQKCFNKH